MDGEMTEIRPIPGFPGYYAGDDGRMYRILKANHGKGTQRLYVNVKVDGEQRRHPLSWYIACAFVPGCAPGMRARHIDGDPLNSKPDNLEWVPIGGWDDKRWRAAKKAELEADPDDGRHGTLTGYRYGCRCERCRKMAKVQSQIAMAYKRLREVRGGERG